MDLSIICINWNSVEYLKECIASIYEQTNGLTYEVVVIDNASTRDNVDILRELFPGIVLIKCHENLGFSRGNNLAFRYSSGAHVLFLNPDTCIVGPALNSMLGHLKTLPDAGIVGCKLLNSDHTLQTSCIQKFPTILNQLTDIEKIRLRWPKCWLWEIDILFSENPRPTVVEVISGACMMLRREVFEKVGLFSEDYFMYAEDIDLSYKTMRAGFKNYYVGDAVVIHHGGQSSKQHGINQWATIMKFRAMTLFCEKTRGKAYAIMFRVVMGCAAIGRLMTIAIMTVFGSKIGKSNASSKWVAILGWATGFENRLARARTDV